MICQYFFETLQHNGVQMVENSIVSQFSKKIPFSSKRRIWTQFSLILDLMICHRDFLKHFGMMGHDRLKKVVLVFFPQKSFFNTIVQLGPNMGQNYATLCPRQLYLMIHSLKILKCSMMGYYSQTKVLLVNLPKKFPF